MSKIPLPQGYGRFKVSYLACSDERLPEERSCMQISKDEFVCKLGNEIQAAFREFHQTSYPKLGDLISND